MKTLLTIRGVPLNQFISVSVLLATLSGCMSQEEYQAGLIGAWKGKDDKTNTHWCLQLDKNTQASLSNSKYNGDQLITQNIMLGSWWVNDGGRLNIMHNETVQINYVDDTGATLIAPIKKQFPEIENRIRYFIDTLTAEQLVYRQQTIGSFTDNFYSHRVSSCEHLQ